MQGGAIRRRDVVRERGASTASANADMSVKRLAASYWLLAG